MVQIISTNQVVLGEFAQKPNNKMQHSQKSQSFHDRYGSLLHLVHTKIQKQGLSQLKEVKNFSIKEKEEKMNSIIAEILRVRIYWLNIKQKH